MIRDNDNNKVKPWVIRDNDKKKVKIRTRKEVDEDTVVGCNAGKYNHNDTDNNNKIRNKMESRTHIIMLIKTEEDGGRLIAPNKAKYNPNNTVMWKEYR